MSASFSFKFAATAMTLSLFACAGTSESATDTSSASALTSSSTQPTARLVGLHGFVSDLRASLTDPGSATGAEVENSITGFGVFGEDVDVWGETSVVAGTAEARGLTVAMVGDPAARLFDAMTSTAGLPDGVRRSPAGNIECKAGTSTFLAQCTLTGIMHVTVAPRG